MQKTECAIKNHPHYVYCGDCDPDNIYNRKGDQNNMKNTKQTAKHTAGEWKIRLTSDNGGECFSGVEETGLITDAIGNTIADTGIAQWMNLRASAARGVSNGEIDRVIAEKQANARLIASAPIMLEALEAVLNMGDDYEAEKLVRKAIAKAKGE